MFLISPGSRWIFLLGIIAPLVFQILIYTPEPQFQSIDNIWKWHVVDIYWTSNSMAMYKSSLVPGSPPPAALDLPVPWNPIPQSPDVPPHPYFVPNEYV